MWRKTKNPKIEVSIPKYVYVLKDIENMDASQFLTEEDIVKLNINKEPIKKLLLQKSLSLQLEIWEQKWRGKEEIAYELTNILVWLSKELDTLEEKFEEYKEKQQEDLKN